MLAEREERFRANGIEAMSTYRQLKRAGHHDDDPFGDVFLDRRRLGGSSGPSSRISSSASPASPAQGLSFGVHVIVGANRWAEIRAALKDTLGTRVELRLGDPSESEIDRRVAAAVPGSRPGRGVTQQRLHFLAALPRIDGSSEPGDLAVAYADLVEKVRTAWDGAPAPRVRMLPASVPYADVLADLPVPDGSKLLPIGLNEDALAPVHPRLRRRSALHLLRRRESGKTTLPEGRRPRHHVALHVRPRRGS